MTTATQFLTLVSVNIELIFSVPHFPTACFRTGTRNLSWPGLSNLLQVQVAKYIVNQYGKHVRKSNVAVLTPYRQQLNEISKRLKGPYEEILVTTITKSQGKAFIIIIIFCR